ncbi:hypothetical protein [Sulfoacidibacillus ferrooxidans]|uniref:Uncharacterized protein n=1 Tax=Sulfoacidibacillus ferrooxidans TaxID=2005001 RepID=A0A9X1VAU8_9BACL|nr:hypothetical protein [Sulfoacidibacillus ferrooxidans]MCI0184861.1 hypothetical protein [Sulfoacidibacillus ferrooxidans]
MRHIHLLKPTSMYPWVSMVISIAVFSMWHPSVVAADFYAKTNDPFASQHTPTLSSLQTLYSTQKNTDFDLASSLFLDRLPSRQIRDSLVKDHVHITFQMENDAPLRLLYVIYTSSAIGITLQAKIDFIQQGSLVTLTSHGIQQLNAVLTPGITYSLLAEGSSSHGFVFMAMPTKSITYQVPSKPFTSSLRMKYKESTTHRLR